MIGRKRWFITLQRVFAPLWKRLGGGCNLTRDTASAIERAGFSIESMDRFNWNAALLAAPHILGVARRT